MTRNGKGEGSVYRTADGRWRGAADLGWVGGKRRRKVVTGRTRAEAARKLRDVLHQNDSGLPVRTDGRAPTVGEWLDTWLETIARPSLAPSTHQRYAGIVRLNIKPHVGDLRLDALEPEHIEAMHAQLGRRLAPATVLQAHRVLSRALKIAVRRGRAARNVCTLVDAPKQRRHEIAPLDEDGARLLLAAASRRRQPARWTVALALGLRQGEALGLGWQHVELDRGTLRVERALQRVKGRGLVLVGLKSERSYRTLPLPGPLVAQLRTHRAAQAAERLASGGDRTSDLVFTTASGRPVDPRNDHRHWKALLADAGLPPARLHDARHTAATLLLAEGVHPRVVMEMLGHSQISLTMNTYSHVPAAVAVDAADRLAGVLLDPARTAADRQ